MSIIESENTHPNRDLRWDPVAQLFKHVPSGIYYRRPPTTRFKYVVRVPFAVEGHRFKTGDVLGTGTVPAGLSEWPAYMFIFEPAEAYPKIAGGLTVGHIAAGIATERIAATAID